MTLNCSVRFFKHRIYFASDCLEKRKLLNTLGVGFDLILPQSGRLNASHVPAIHELPERYLQRVCIHKVQWAWQELVARRLPERVVLAASSAVLLENRFLSRPTGAEHAASMLRQLSGGKHHVLTAVSVGFRSKVDCLVTNTMISFRDITENEILLYLRTGEPMNHFGGYSLCGVGARFVSQLNGSYSGALGLPLCETLELLKRYGL